MRHKNPGVRCKFSTGIEGAGNLAVQPTSGSFRKTVDVFERRIVSLGTYRWMGLGIVR